MCVYICIANKSILYTHDVNTHTHTHKNIYKQNIIRRFGRGLLQSNKQKQIERERERERVESGRERKTLREIDMN